VALKLLRGRLREVHWLMMVVAVAFVAYFAIDPLEHLLGVAG
jgi:AGZA family xanthine/uracil permease-like MFS transporter